MVNSKFNQNCYRLLKKIPLGRVTTYKEIARALSSKGYRAVGNAMGRNPNAPQVPCHRVVCSDGRIGGYAFGPKRKIDILRREGVEILDGRVKDFKAVFYKF